MAQHAARFELALHRVLRTLRDTPWRDYLQDRPRTVAVLEGVEAGLQTPALVRACRLLYEDYVSVRIACNSLMRIFDRLTQG